MTRNVENPILGSRSTQSAPDLLSPFPPSKRVVLEMLTSPEIMAHFFRTRLSSILPEGMVLRECRPRVLKKRLASRQVLWYRLIFSDKEYRSAKVLDYVIKRFLNRSNGSKEYSNMKMLWERGFNSESSLKIPRPLCYVENMGLLVQERARGMVLRKNLNRSGPETLEHMKQAARWLQKLHRLNARLDGVILHRDDCASLAEFVDRTLRHQPNLLTKMEALVSRISMRLSSLGTVSFTLAHGDFQCENIFIDRDSVTVVDFGQLSLSDPARDPGYMIAQARTMGFLNNVPNQSLVHGLHVFWEEYLHAVPAAERPLFSARTSVFAAIKYIENLYYMSCFRLRRERAIFSFLLDEARRFAQAQGVEEVL